jgi:hypothetical protein
MVSVAGVAWEDLLTPDAEEDVAAAPPSAGEGEGIVLSAPEADHGALNDTDKAEAASLIETLSRLELSAATREDLADYKNDLAAGTMEKMDLKYLRALAKRLSK